MAAGQTILTLSAIVLLYIISMNIRQIYVRSTENTVDSQIEVNALNFGRDLSERIQSYTFNYDQLVNDYYGLDDVTVPSSRISHTTSTGETLYATFDISDHEPLIHGQNGRTVTITIFIKENNQYRRKAEYTTIVLPM